MFIILQELMHKTFVEIEGRPPKRHEIPKPCDHFDLIAGTGTGGLIAIMLGRLRLDLDTCKEVYVRMTRRVFETDKTLFGLPYKGTMFKASKLEDSIRDCVREHTIFDDEGNDSLASATAMSPTTPTSAGSGFPQRSPSQSSRYSQIGMRPMTTNRGMGSFAYGNPNTPLYDTRENRTKTAVTAVLRGTSDITLLRSYDSRREPAPDVNCTIWQAGRATCATQMAFKPIQIGQSVYLDEGAGKYNPAPLVLDEAVQNEWPGREVGVFVSIGTGKRPPGTGARQHEWWEDFLGGSSTIGSFAEARRRLISKLEGCEESHQYMLSKHLAARGVNPENYTRLNVEVGVGEFGMSEWDRLAEMTTNTRSYLVKNDVQRMSSNAAAGLARVHFAKVRYERQEARKHTGPEGPRFNQQNPWDRPIHTGPPLANAFAVELPGDEGFRASQQYEHRPSVADQKYTVQPDSYYSQQGFQNSPHYSPSQHSARPSADYQGSVHFSQNGSPRHSQDFFHQQQQTQAPPRSPPPVPPKTPVNASALPYPDEPTPSLQSPDTVGGARTFMNMGDLGRRLPYPEGPPPTVNMANKPAAS